MSLGFSFRYVTDTRLENGKDNLDQYKVLILPRSCAVSDDLAKKINDFVRNGGTVIADIRAGIMDEHLNLRQPGAFDQAAGIRRKEVLPAVHQTLNPSLNASKQHFESGIEPAGGKAFRKTEQGIPAMIVNHYGKGMFVTLNFPFNELPAMATMPKELRRLLLDAFSKVPARTVFTTGDTGAPCYDLRRGEWKNGDMLILGVKSKPGEKKQLHAVLPAPMHVFSIDGEKSCGKVSSFDFQITPPKPEFFVLTAKPLPEITVNVPGTVERGSTLTVTYTVKGMKGERPLRLSYERDGKPLDLYTVREVSANDTVQQAHFRVALNEIPGKYTVTARDVYTGKTTVFPITIH
ncbi:MAG: Beta-galactosidase BgaP [Lentisphaerae bacterium ADurb.Bin242]|nr:MAG: Beta-galactosidase BgaP [Lentisphaerae bacterium ADurb.Bin242]